MRTTHSSCDSFNRTPNWPNSKQQQNTSEANTVQTHIQPKDPKAREGQLQNLRVWKSKSLKIQEFENFKVWKIQKIRKFENSKIQKFKNSKIQKFKDSKIQKFKNSKIRDKHVYTDYAHKPQRQRYKCPYIS